MSTNSTIIEVIKFTSQGVPELVAQTRVISDQIVDATKRFQALNSLMANPTYGKTVDQMDRVAKSFELASLKMRNYVQQQQLDSGFAQKQAKSIADLNTRHERMNATLRNRVLAERIADGSEPKRIREMEKLNSEYTRLQKKAELTAKYGERAGDFLHRYGGLLNAGGAAFGGLATMGAGLARRGFEGTTEQAHQDFEMKLLARQFASVMKPISDLTTRLVRSTRERMERLNEGGQNALMGGIIAGGAGGGLMALRTASRLIGEVAGESMASKFRSGVGRFALGGLGAAGLAYGVATNNVGAGAAGGAALGFSLAGLPGAIVGAAAGGLTARAQGLPDAKLGETPGEYYTRRRLEGGRTRFGAGVDVALESPSEIWRKLTMTDAARRDVQISAGGFEEPGSAAERINIAAEKVKPPAPAGPPAPDSFDKMLTALEEIRDSIKSGEGWRLDRARPPEGFGR